MIQKASITIGENLHSKPKKLVTLISLTILIIITLLLLTKQYGEIRESEAAKNETLVFEQIDSNSLNKAQEHQSQKLTENNVSNSSKIFTLSIKSGIANVGIISIPIDGKNYNFNKPVIEKNNGVGATSWKSQLDIEGTKSNALFTYADNHLAGTIQTKPDKTYRISEIDTNLYVLSEYKIGEGIKDDVAEKTKKRITGLLESAINENLSVAPSPRIIRVLLAYDPHAREHFKLPNGSSTVVAEVIHQMQIAKDAFRDSGFVHEFRVVEVYEMAGSLSSLHNDYISNHPQLFFQMAVKAINTNADIAVASVLEVGGGACGVAGAMPQQHTDNLLKRVALVDYECYDLFTFPHEIGHLFGADHDRVNSVMGLDGMNHGYYITNYTDYNNINYGDIGTIMSSIGRRHPSFLYFSNTNTILDRGLMFGNPDFADNVRVMNAIGPLVAGYSWGSSGTGSSGGTKGCGEVCANASQCQNGFYCLDISANTAGNECWNESMCIVAPPRNRRISGKVLDCNGNPKANVKVATKGFSFNKSANTNSQGIFQIWETNNECSVDKDTGQTFAVLAGKDADSNQTDFYGRVASPVFSKPEINCGNVNCNYTGNQASGGPNRQNYHLSVSAFVNNPNVYNTYVCEEDGNFLSGFDFKQVNCPVATPTPAPLTCNSVCTSDAQCSSSNSNWYCSTQFSYGGWSDISNNVGSIQYKVGNNIYTDSGTTTGFNKALMNDGVIEQHLVKGGKVYSNRYTPSTGWDQYWTDSTSNIPSTIPGTTIDFNSYRKPNGKIEQHLIKTSGSTNKVYTQNNEQGWAQATWVDVTISSNILVNTGTGPVTGFTAHVDKDGYIIQNMVRGGQLWERNNIGGWANATWRNITTGLNGCAGVGANKCGNATLLTVERNRNNENKDEFFLIRAGGKMYHRVSTPTDKRCRLKANPYSPTCSLQ